MDTEDSGKKEKAKEKPVSPKNSRRKKKSSAPDIVAPVSPVDIEVVTPELDKPELPEIFYTGETFSTLEEGTPIVAGFASAPESEVAEEELPQADMSDGTSETIAETEPAAEEAPDADVTDEAPDADVTEEAPDADVADEAPETIAETELAVEEAPDADAAEESPDADVAEEALETIAETEPAAEESPDADVTEESLETIAETEPAAEESPDADAAEESLDADVTEESPDTDVADEAPETTADAEASDETSETIAETEPVATVPAFAPFVKKSAKTERPVRNRKKRKKIGIAGNIVRGFFAAVAVILLIGIGYGANYLYNFISDLPKHDMAEIEASLKTMSTIYDDQGVEMKDIYIADSMRELVTYEQIPPDLINAIVAIEDKTFWSHKGFNVIRMFGALRESYLGGGEISGTSTISQQLARNIWLAETRSEYSLERKMKEAVFARELEENLTKEEIMTHYLNMVAFGNHSYGVAAASRLYFNKDVSDLDILECASLAALPQSPSKHSMITTVPVGFVSLDDSDILLATDEYIFLYNEDALPRIHLVLGLMYEQGYITEAEYNNAINDDLRRHLHPQPLQTHGNDAFFIDWMINDVAGDIMTQYPEEFPTIDDALQLVYSGGLEIYSTFNQRMQDICTEEFENPANYPVAYMNRDRDGNILGDDREIVLFDYNNMFVNRAASEENQEQALAGQDPDSESTKDDLAGIGEPWFWLNEDDFEMLPNGGMRIFAGSDKRLGIYKTNGAWGEDVSVEFKDFYTRPPNSFYIIKGGVINIPTEYKGIDAAGNLILSPKLFESEDNIFTFVPFEQDEDGEEKVLENGARGEYWIAPEHFTLDQPVIQPQGATTIIEHQTGQVKAMIGGRGIEGAMQYNRSLAPRQPGSTMKPLGVYAPGLQKSAEGLPVSYPDESLGEYWTAASIINDEPMEYEGRVWPNNWYGGYRGPQTMRKAIEQSINVCAVRAQLAVGNKRSIEFLKKLGVTSIVESGEINDLNPSALALGGMTVGISPLENASAYGTFANKGVHVDPIGYTVVKFRDGEILLDGTPQSEQVMDPGAAFIMQDMLRTAVSNGIANRARVRDVPVAGKTGTSSEQVDAWFAGFTPKYVASVWIGIDVKMRMSQNSAAAAGLFSKIMTRIYGEDESGEFFEEPGEFASAPANVERSSVSGVTDYFIKGTKPDLLVYGDLVCVESGYLATPDCPVTERRVVRPLNGATSNYSPEELAAMEAGAPVWYCSIHNTNHTKYPIDPAPPAPSYSYSEPSPPEPPVDPPPVNPPPVEPPPVEPPPVDPPPVDPPPVDPPPVDPPPVDPPPVDPPPVDPPPVDPPSP